MPSIADFKRDSESSVITVRDIDIAITYNPDRVTVGDMSAVARIEQTYDFGTIARLLNRMVESWDVTGPITVEEEDEDGEVTEIELVAEGDVVPFTSECLEALGMNFMSEFMDALFTEAIKGPNPTKARKSGRSRRR